MFEVSVVPLDFFTFILVISVFSLLVKNQIVDKPVTDKNIFIFFIGLTLKHNCLQRIPPDICQLVNLRSLDLSHNKLRTLPAEIGELIHLR